MSALANRLKSEGKDIISLSAGEPDFGTPKHVKEAAIEAIKAGATKYTNPDGMPELKEAISQKFVTENNLKYEPSQISVGTGGKQIIYNALMATLNPEDEVIIPAPYWVSYPDMVKLAGGIPKIIKTASRNDYKVQANDLRASITENTKWLILNSPSNPTGAAYTFKELKMLTDVLLEFPKVNILSDDIYEHIIYDELDLKREAANCAQLKRNFEATEELSELLYIPAVIWDLSTINIMVVERIYGIPVSDIDALKANKTNLKTLAERGVKIFFTQVFEHNFFHADMHPGNIFVDRENPESPRYIGIDCAIMGSLSDFDRYYLGRNFLAVFNRDYALVAKLHIESGWVPAGTNQYAFEGMIRSACEPIFEKPLAEISFGTLLIYLFPVSYTHLTLPTKRIV